MRRRVSKDLDTEPGTVYSFSYAFSARPNTGLAENKMDVKWDGDVIATRQHDGTGKANTAWTVYSHAVVATTHTTRIDFIYTGLSDSLGGYLDSVKVVAQTCASVKNGNWSASDTWSCGAKPGPGNNVSIELGHEVTQDDPGAKAKDVWIKSGGKLKGQDKEVKVKGDWTQDGAFDKGTSTVKFDGKDKKQLIKGNASSKEFHKVEVDKGAKSDAQELEITDGSVKILEELKVTKGQIKTDNTEVKNLKIESAGKLKAKASDKKLKVRGDWSQVTNGEFDPNSSTVVFDGAGDQQIVGTSSKKEFFKLEVEKSAGKLFSDNSVEVLEKLHLKAGQMEAGNTKTKDVEIAGPAVLISKPAALHEVQGNWVQNGAFDPKQSKVTFTGDQNAQILGAALTKQFHMLEIVKSTTPTTVTASGALFVTSGMKVLFGTYVSSTTYGDVEIGPDGVLVVPEDGEVFVNGNWTNNGAFTPAKDSVVTFQGNGAQTIGGDSATTFTGLVINSTVNLNSPVTVQGTLVLNANLTIGLGSLTLDEGAKVEAEEGFTLADAVSPTLGEITVPVSVVPVNTLMNASAPFSDPGLLDVFVADWDWGNGSTSAGSVAYDKVNQTGVASGGHVYTSTGMFRVSLKLTDDDGFDQATYLYVVVYDPDGGFLTGGGWFNSQAGACTLTLACETATGKANVNVTVRYDKKSASVPTGMVKFDFKTGKLDFNSTGFEWLVVDGTSVQLQGSGNINGAGNYGILITAESPTKGKAKVRVKIWDKDTGDVVYDSQPGADDDVAPATDLGGGSINVQTKGKN